MTNVVPKDSVSLEELMEFAQSRALLDNWTMNGEAVRLTVGMYEIELRRPAAILFLRGLLKNYEHAIEVTSE